MMNFISLGDLHLDYFPKGIYLNKDKLIDYRFKVLDFIINYANKNNIKEIINFGDFYDKPRIENFKILKKTLEFFKKANENGIRCDIIMGNHNIIKAKNDYFSPLEIFKIFNNVKIYEKSERVTIKDIDFYMIPADYKWSKFQDNFNDYLKNIYVENNHKKILVTHIQLKGFDDESSRLMEEFSEGLDYKKIWNLNKFDFISLSHIHKYIEIIPNKMYYSGCIFQLNYGDSNQKQKYILDVKIDDDGKVEVKKVELPIFYNLVSTDDLYNFKDIENNFITWNIKNPSDEFLLNFNEEDAIDFVKKHNGLGLKINFIKETKDKKILNQAQINNILNNDSDLIYEYFKEDKDIEELKKMDDEIRSEADEY